METFAAILTAVFYWAFMSYLASGNRQQARKHAGQLLMKATKKSSFGRFGDISLGIFAVGVAVFWIYLLVSSVYTGIPMRSSMLLVWLFNMPLIGWMAILRIINSRIELHRHGLLTPTSSNWPLSFVPWSHIRYCKWLFSNSGVLLLQFQDRNEQIEVDPNEIDKITAVLADHVDIRDSSGITINAEHLPFAYPDEPEPLKRHSLQFNLKTALLFMVVASSAFAWLGIHLRADWREQEALAQLEEFGVEVGYNNGWVQRLDFSKGSGSLSDDDLRHLAAFKQLRWLDLSKTPITDAGLVHIKDLTRLTSLNLWKTKVTDAGLVNIKGMTRLTTLQLDCTNVSDAGLMHLEPLIRLKQLGLSETQVNDAGLIHLKPLTQLEQLGLSGTKVTDAGLVHIEGLTGLGILHLDFTQVTDVGMLHMEPLTQLESLTLLGTKVTEAGLVPLKELPDLKNITFDDPKAPAVKASLPIRQPPAL